jgi:hypothetical protein
MAKEEINGTTQR